MKRFAQIITALVFCLFLGGFAVAHVLLPDRDFSEVENRSLQKLPQFSLEGLKEGTYTKSLETYLEDQFPLRDGWMGLKNRYEYLLGQREFSGVYYCGDRLIARVDKSTRADKNLEYVAGLAEKTDIPVYFGLIPTAAEVWKDLLPEGAPSFDQVAYLEQAAGLADVDVDLLGALSAHSDEAIYYRTDHHWTSLGAYYGYAAILEAMGMEPQPLGEKTTVSTDFNGTLYSTSGIHWLQPDEIDTYVPDEGVTVTTNTGAELLTGGLYVPEKLEGKDKYTYFLGGNQPLYILENPNATTDKKLLVVRDSYSDSLAPFLSQDFAEIHLLDLRYYRVPVAAYAEEMGADAILVAYSVDNFQKDENIIFMAQ